MYTTRTSVMLAALSTAFTMSMTVRPAAATPVSASISAPVRPTDVTRTSMSTRPSPTVRSTVTPSTAIGCAKGTRSGVRLTAAIPATRATARPSPFGRAPRARRSAAPALSWTTPRATASRRVTGFPDTSTMRTCPAASAWVRPVTAAPGSRGTR